MSTTSPQAYKVVLVACITFLSFATGASTYAVDEELPNPTVRVNAFEDYVTSNADWPLGAFVSVVVTDSGDLTKCSGSATVFEQPEHDWIGFELWFDGCDIEPGDIVTAASGLISASVIVSDLAVTGVDEVTHTVSGTAVAGTVVQVHGGNGEVGGWRQVTVNAFGNWSATFTEAGLSLLDVLDGDGWFELTPGSGGAASQYDLESDETFVWWNVPEPPAFTVQRDHGSVWGGGFASFELLTIAVDGTPIGDPFTADENGNFQVNVEHVFHPDQTVTVGSKVLVISGVVVTGTDPATGQISGLAEPGATVQVWVEAEGFEGQGIIAHATTGAWSVTFGPLSLGIGGGAAVIDTDGDQTQVNWSIPNPTVRVNAHEDFVTSNSDWPLGTIVTVTVVDLTSCVETATVEQWDEWSSGFNVWFDPATCDIQPGHEVTAESNDISTSVIVTDIAITNVDEATHTVTGTAEPLTEVQVDGGNEDQGGWRYVSVDPSGDWSATFTQAGLELADVLDGDGWFELTPGTGGQASQYDTEGDETFLWWGIEEPPNPTVRVNPFEDYVTSNADWPLDADVSVVVTDSGDLTKCSGSATVFEQPEHEWIGFELWFDGCDIVPDDTVTASYAVGELGEIVTSVVVTPVEVTEVDPASGTVSGVAVLGSEVHVGGGNEAGGAWRVVVADQTPPEGYDVALFGGWTADFREVGQPADPSQGEGWFELTPGTGGEASQYDLEGDDTFVWWGIEEPQLPMFTVQRDHGGVWGGGFEPGEALTVAVDVNPAGVDGDEFVSDSFFADENGDFNTNVGESWTFEPDQLVTVGSKTLILSSVVVTLVNPTTGEIAGTAEPDVLVQVWIHEEDGEGYETTADGSGVWSVPFTSLPPGTAGAAAVSDEDWDQTQVDWWIANPTVRVSAVDDYVTSNADWPLGADVVVSVTGLPGCDQTVTVIEFDGWFGFEASFNPDTCDIVPGDTVTATHDSAEHGVIEASVEVTPLEVLGVDEDADTVFGVAEFGTEVQVHGWNDTDNGWRQVLADGDIPAEIEGFDASFGWWEADFTPGGAALALAGDGWIDLRPGTGGEAFQTDLEGDDTFVWWGIEEPQLPMFTVQRDHGGVWGGGFEPGEALTVAVDDDPGVGDGDEFVSDSFFADENGDFNTNVGESWTFEPDQLVTVGSKTLILSSVVVTLVNPTTGEIAGTAEPDVLVQVWIHEEDGEGYETTADGSGVWSVPFTSLPPGTAGAAAVSDEDWDQTQVDWHVNRLPVASDDFFETDEDTGLVGLDVLENDWDEDGDLVAYLSHDTNSVVGEVVWDGSFFAYEPGDGFDYLAPGETATDSWTYVIGDGRGGESEATVEITVEGANDSPAMDDQSDQTVQYSDGLAPIIFTATDVDSDHLDMSATGLPDSLTTVSLCAPSGANGVTCTLTITGTVSSQVGDYEVEVVADDDGMFAIAYTTIHVIHEDADVSLHGGNETAIRVNGGATSDPFDLTFKVRHVDPDVGFEPTPGDLALAVPELILDPVGPGGPVTGLCGAVSVSGTGYDTQMTATCSFGSVASNAYLVTATVAGDHFVGSANGVLVIYDPNSGQVEGGGTFDWDGDLTEFGFTMEYNKKGKHLKGSFLMIRHASSGDYIVKSNSLYGMATGKDGSTSWATFAGKATMTIPSGDTVGNHEFIVRVTDDPDTFWIEVRDKARDRVEALSMERDADGEPVFAIVLLTGDVVVPGGNGKGKKK